MKSVMEFIPRKKIHFIGIGGVGMSALAQILLARGFAVSGSDVKETTITKRLEALGATIFFSHKSENVQDVDVVVYSSCIGMDNPEITCAKRQKIKLIKRAVLLSMLMKEKVAIAVSGAHGKTTTSALIAFLLKKSGLNPSFAVGAEVDILGGNAQHGMGKYFVAEADESDGSFLFIKPEYAVITNIDKEHLDYYKNLKHIVDTYARFINNAGILLCCGEDKNTGRALKKYKGNLITYGFNKSYNIYVSDVHSERMFSRFGCVYNGRFIDTFELKIPGRHNILNSLACIAIGIELKIDKELIKSALAEFSGAKRRFQIKSDNGRIMIIDDYAHHPTEIIATLKAAKTWKNKRVVVVFQPHRYSRTKFLKKEFGKCFSYADYIVITDIYSAFESPIKGIGAATIYQEIKKNGHKNAALLPREKLKEHLLEVVRDGDILMMLGAGDIGNLAEELTEKFMPAKSSQH